MPLVTLPELNAALNLGTDMTHADELLRYIDAADAYVTRAMGPFPSGTFTERVTPYQGRLLLRHWPVLSITSATDDWGTEYEDNFTVRPDGYTVVHDTVYFTGDWTVVYEAGFAEVPADLKLAVLEDIRGLFQPGQIGPPAAFGAFGIENTDTGPTFRPVRLWPRIDGWIAANRGPVLA